MTREFIFGGQLFELAGEAALYWPEQRCLLVSDLHLEKASSFAARGQMLPPYDSVSTLRDIAALIGKYRPDRVVSLGDNFHDNGGEARLATQAASLLVELIAQADWVWITGNHDRDVEARWGGTAVDEIDLGGIYLRHEALKGETAPEISGHFHPKFRQQLRGRMVARRCFVRGPRKLIMPAFGTLTGGLDAQHIAIQNACDLAESEYAEAIVPMATGFVSFRLNCSLALAK